MYTRQQLNNWVPVSMSVWEHHDRASYYLKHSYREGEEIHVVSMDISYKDMCLSSIENAVEYLLNEMYDHGNGD